MPKLPFPPDAPYLRGVFRREHRYLLPAGTLIWRIHPQAGPYPTRWDELRHVGPTGSRFDHHLPGQGGRMLMDPATGRAAVQPRGIIYLASNITACVAEYFQTDRVINRTDRVINRARSAPWLVGFETVAPLDDLVRISATLNYGLV